MDRPLKERIIGATVLVVVAVLVVPVFLDGPGDVTLDEPALLTEPVALPGQGGQDTQRQTIVLERDREQPVPAAGSTERDARAPERVAPSGKEATTVATARPPAPRPEPERAAAAPEPATAEPQRPTPQDAQAGRQVPSAGAAGETTAAASASATGMWAVQLGSFSNQDNAERLAGELRKEGYAAFLSRVRTSSETLHRVRVGPQENRRSAEQVAAKLAADGHTGQVVPHP